MSGLTAAIRRARETGDFGPLAEVVPYARFLGITAETTDGDLLGRLRYADHLVGNPLLPALHGGAIGALLESTAIFKLLASSDVDDAPKTISVTIEYLRSAGPSDTLARAVITRQGRRVASVHVIAWQDDAARPVARANAQFLLPGGTT